MGKAEGSYHHAAGKIERAIKTALAKDKGAAPRRPSRWLRRGISSLCSRPEISERLKAVGLTIFVSLGNSLSRPTLRCIKATSFLGQRGPDGCEESYGGRTNSKAWQLSYTAP
jgi:hypothetical protein